MDQIKKMRDDVHLDEGLVEEILVRLPAKSVLCYRAVCKEWLRITKCPAFLAEHARRRPLEVLLYTRTTAAVADGVGRQVLALDAVAVSGGPRRPVARHPLMAEPRTYRSIQYCPLLASCDGLLLLGVGGVEPEQYLICNPTTRQWSDLPRPSGYAGLEEHRESGFYFHEPSGEYRLLYYVSKRHGTTAYYCVLSVGANVPRRLAVQATPIEHTVAVASHGGHEFGSLHNLMTPAVLHGHLHWLQHMEAGLSGQMVAFDTVAETFRRMPPPPVTQKKNSNLLAADGSLMACEPGHLFIDLWALDGYAGAAATGKERWERRHRIEVPWKAYTLVLTAGDDEGHVVVGTKLGVLAYNVRSGAVRLLTGVDASGGPQAVDPSRHVLRESLVRHDFFERRPHPGLPFFSFCT
ncbi:uncharacterized protein [Lolium perenne]|uniref:uncharacterized protein n=1 Tax=Lolium perenne TaxID=4522 RepID=UPI0021EAC8CD|nr:uncharacterized protein LOC127337013 [Lolium perenne]